MHKWMRVQAWLMQLIRHHRMPVIWLQQHLTHQQFILVSAFLVGISGGIAAVVLKSLVHLVHKLLTWPYPESVQYILLALFPLIGIIGTLLIKKLIFRDKLGRGLSNLLIEIRAKKGLVRRDKMYSHIITSAVTVGFGGSSGLEAPIVVTGSAIGSNFGKSYNLNLHDRTVMLGAGAAAGIAGAFNAPVAGVMFVMEVLLVGTRMTQFIPLIVAAASGALVSNFFLHQEILLFIQVGQDYLFKYIPLFLLLGLFTGLWSLYYSKVTLFLEKQFAKFGKNDFTKAIVGGLLLSALCVIFPPLFGEGYNVITALAKENTGFITDIGILKFAENNKWYLLAGVLVIGLIKVWATATTILSGGNGGNFAPSLFSGAFAGFVFGSLVNYTGFAFIPISHCIVVGMAGVLSGVMFAPLTGIFLIAEITGSYSLFIPLMLVSAMSFFMVKSFRNYSLENEKLAEKGLFHTDTLQEDPILNTINPIDLVYTEDHTIKKEDLLSKALDLYVTKEITCFAVVDDKNRLTGWLNIEDLVQNDFQKDGLVADYFTSPPAVLRLPESCSYALSLFKNAESNYIPVVINGVCIGTLSKNAILREHRKKLTT